MGIVISALIILGILIIAANMGEKRTGAATLNPNNAANLYVKQPQLRQKLLEMANGNIQALEILERLATLKHKYNHIDIAKFIQLDMYGYEIEYAYRAIGKDIMKLAVATSSNSDMMKLVKHIEAVKYAALPSTSNTIMTRVLNEYEFEDLDELLDSKNTIAYKAVISWKTIVDIIKPEKGMEQAIMNFLVPDEINAAQWLINFSALNGQRWDFDNQIPDTVKYLCDNPIMGYPIWFKAGYSHVIMWLKGPESEITEKLGVETYNLIEQYFETAPTDAKLNLTMLRMICNAYEQYQEKKQKSLTF